jgi:acyl-CoA thioester hydrolase
MPRLQLDIAHVRQLPLLHGTTIPEEYLDIMGHMNVMWYTHLFSVAMGGLSHLVGLTWEYMQSHRVGTFALESHIRYLSEVQAGQNIEIHTRVLGRTEKRFHALHFMTNLEKQDVSATFEFVAAYIDMTKRRMAPIPPDIARSLDDLIAEHQKLRWPAPICGGMAS